MVKRYSLDEAAAAASSWPGREGASLSLAKTT